MDYKVIWSPRGIACLRELVQYIAKHNPAGARKIGEAILEKVGLLEQWPRIGKVFRRCGREDTREILGSPLSHHLSRQGLESNRDRSGSLAWCSAGTGAGRE